MLILSILLGILCFIVLLHPRAGYSRDQDLFNSVSICLAYSIHTTFVVASVPHLPTLGSFSALRHELASFYLLSLSHTPVPPSA